MRKFREEIMQNFVKKYGREIINYDRSEQIIPQVFFVQLILAAMVFADFFWRHFF